LALPLASCSVHRFIPENEYLLDEVSVTSDNKEVKASAYQIYIRQHPNAKWFSLTKVPMHLYCLSGRDSSKWMNRFFRAIGDEPVIYDASLAERTRGEIEKAVRNKGFMAARVEVDENARKRKMKVAYRIKTGRPYIVNSLHYEVDDDQIRSLMARDSARSYLHEGMTLDVELLEAERQRLTKILLNEGYYAFNKDFWTYQADTVRNTYKVDLTLRLLPYRRRKEDEPQPHKMYRLNTINFVSDFHDVRFTDNWLEGLDSLRYKQLNLYYKQRPILRPQVLNYANRMLADVPYSEQRVQLTHEYLGRLNALKYANIRFQEVATADTTAALDAYVLLTKNPSKSVTFEVEGTNSAGDLGAAASVSMQHRNLFHGSETFTLKFRGAYEAVTGLGIEDNVNNRYTEYAIEGKLNFPEFKFPFLSSNFKRRIKATSEVGLKFSPQIRPEFSRTLASASWSYKWSSHQGTQHRFDLLDINYVYMSRQSETFKEYLDNMTAKNSLLRASYEDVLIVRMGYGFTYHSAGHVPGKTPTRNSYSLRFNVEEAGNLLYACSKLAHSEPRTDKGYVLANIPFAQYVKTDIDFAKNFVIDFRNSIVFHAGFGIAYPYGNLKALPFEKRYFSGGANSVRGWSVRSLGPGGYKSEENGRRDFIKQSGDMKLDLNLEYRTHLFWKLNGAAFVDAGNVWTLREDATLEDGAFRWDSFLRQIAVAYGLGIRFDLDYLVLRFDGGMKAINPAEKGKLHYPFNHPDFSRDFAFHFAVGYPF
jgi:outer membrane translocation and assembly module TamA